MTWPEMFPESVAEAGAPSVELTVAVLANGPGVAEAVTSMVIAAKDAPGATLPAGSVQDTFWPATAQVQPVPDAEVGVSPVGNVSVTVTVSVSFTVLEAETPGVRVTESLEFVNRTPLPLSVLVSDRTGPTCRLVACRLLMSWNSLLPPVDAAHPKASV